MPRWLFVLLAALVPWLLAARLVQADDSDSTPAPLPWARSIVCPVLYTHEVRSQALLRRLFSGLLAAGYHPTSLAEVDAAMQAVADPPAGCLVLTFDDALLSQYLNALPVLTELNIPAVFFALPGFADGVHRYMSLDQVRALAEAGFEVEAHTCNHANLPVLARRNLDAFFAEVQDCKRVLEGIIQQSVEYLAYPLGAYDLRVLDEVARSGYRAAFTTRPSARLTANSPYTLPRIRYDASEAPSNVLRRIRAAGG
jgi:peptidoglycan/xylan/chitin deacetylase (PgdA/CDA1 family)